MKVVISSTLPVPTTVAWNLLKQTNTLRYVAEGVMTYDTENLPAEWKVGTTVNLLPRLWGRSQGDHFVTIVALSNKSHSILTEEYGGPITKWDHTMQLETVNADSCTLTDTIEISAGWRTLLVYVFAMYFYRHRHRRWQQLLVKK